MIAAGVRASALLGASGVMLGWAAARNRAYALQREVAQLRNQTVDPVTGLPIRSVWESDARVLLDSSSASAVLLIADLDDFKSINDRFGHPAGDAVLREVARRLTSAFACRDPLVARLGGDEFAVMARNLAGSSDVDRFRESMLQPISVPSGAAVQVSVSLGVVECRALVAPVSLSGALLVADSRLYMAKRSTRRQRRHGRTGVSPDHIQQQASIQVPIARTGNDSPISQGSRPVPRGQRWQTGPRLAQHRSAPDARRLCSRRWRHR